MKSASIRWVDRETRLQQRGDRQKLNLEDARYFTRVMGRMLSDLESLHESSRRILEWHMYCD